MDKLARRLLELQFSARYPDIASGYMTNSNAWFERIASVPARGRLTLNGFFGCRRSAA